MAQDHQDGAFSGATAVVEKIGGQRPQSLEDFVRALLANEKGLNFRTEGLDDLPTIQADETRLFNAFYNLINNAIPEVRAGGSVTLRGHVEQENKRVVLEIADTGKGMPPDVRDSLFTNRARSTKVGGTGLGTKIVKDVVDAHSGTISVDSEEGKGTTFIIRLPINQD